MVDLLVSGLAVWRLAHMLVEENGPLDIFWRLREHTGVEVGVHGDLVGPTWNPLSCVLCTSVWVAPLIIGLPPLVRRILAASAIACLLEKV